MNCENYQLVTILNQKY